MRLKTDFNSPQTSKPLVNTRKEENVEHSLSGKV